MKPAYVAPLHPREAQRLEAVHALPTPHRGVSAFLERASALAALVTGQPIAAISLIDTDEHRFLSLHGLDAPPSVSRDLSFCGHTILQDDVLEIADLRTDARMAGHPMVVGEPEVSFYAGTPLMTSDDLPVGALCVMGQQPSELSESQREMLKFLADWVMDVIRDAGDADLEQRLTQALAVRRQTDTFRASLQHLGDAILARPLVLSQDAALINKLTQLFGGGQLEVAPSPWLGLAMFERALHGNGLRHSLVVLDAQTEMPIAEIARRLQALDPGCPKMLLASAAALAELPVGWIGLDVAAPVADWMQILNDYHSTEKH